MQNRTKKINVLLVLAYCSSIVHLRVLTTIGLDLPYKVCSNSVHEKSVQPFVWQAAVKVIQGKIVT